MADKDELDEQELNALLDRLIEGKAPDEIMGLRIPAHAVH